MTVVWWNATSLKKNLIVWNYQIRYCEIIRNGCLQNLNKFINSIKYVKSSQTNLENRPNRNETLRRFRESVAFRFGSFCSTQNIWLLTTSSLRQCCSSVCPKDRLGSILFLLNTADLLQLVWSHQLTPHSCGTIREHTSSNRSAAGYPLALTKHSYGYESTSRSSTMSIPRCCAVLCITTDTDREDSA